MASCAQLVYQEGKGHRGAASHLVMCVCLCRLACKETEVLYQMYVIARKHFGQGGPKRIGHTHKRETSERQERKKRGGKPQPLFSVEAASLCLSSL